MRMIGGADGCKGGWVLAARDIETGTPSLRLCASIHDIFRAAPELVVLAIDIPIGLPQQGVRTCDVLARRLLARRGCCVFPAPIRPVLDATGYAEACEVRFRAEDKRMSHQAWGIVPKIREVDGCLRCVPALRGRVRESHPEVCFATMAGGEPCRHNKKSHAGREERRRLLERHLGPLPAWIPPNTHSLRCAGDDVLDALAVLWTAERIVSGRAVGLPIDPPLDACGLRMEIVA